MFSLGRKLDCQLVALSRRIFRIAEHGPATPQSTHAEGDETSAEDEDSESSDAGNYDPAGTCAEGVTEHAHVDSVGVLYEHCRREPGSDDDE
jgi:hypothetical protein